MERQNVVSREYKVMLLPELFNGEQAAVQKQAKALWKDVSLAIAGVVLHAAGDLSQLNTRRLVSMLDTDTHVLNDEHYIFRERRELDEDKREMTLKFRHPDRFFSQARDMQVAGAAKAKTKFEEDIKAPFVSLYSFSTTVSVADDARWKSIRDLIGLFPDLEERIGGLDPDATLKPPKDFVVREHVLTGATVQIGKTPAVEAEWGLILWYDEHEEHTRPVVAELSYRYGDKNEAYGGGVARRALEIFHLLQSELTDWLDPVPRTKTAFVFD